MTSRKAKNSRTAVVSAKVAHILAWAAFLWIAFWPHSYQGVALIDVGVDGSSTMTNEVWLPFCPIHIREFQLLMSALMGPAQRRV